MTPVVFQSNLRKQIRKLPKFLKFVISIQYYSILFNRVLNGERKAIVGNGAAAGDPPQDNVRQASSLATLIVEISSSFPRLRDFRIPSSRRAAACGRAELLANGQYTDRLQNPAKLRRFRIGGRIRGGIGGG